MSDEVRLREIEERALEYQRNFSYKNFKVIRKELFAHLKDPSLTIREDGIIFNAACINKLEGVVYIKLLIDEDSKQLAVKKGHPDDKNTLRWCIEKKDGSRKSRKISGRDFSAMVYNLMQWDKQKRYKLMGFLIEVEDEPVYIFDLTMTEKLEMRRRAKKKTLAEATEAAEEPTDEIAVVKEPTSERPPVSDSFQTGFSEKLANTYGDTVEEDEARRKMSDLGKFAEVQ